MASPSFIAFIAIHHQTFVRVILIAQWAPTPWMHLRSCFTPPQAEALAALSEVEVAKQAEEERLAAEAKQAEQERVKKRGRKMDTTCTSPSRAFIHP